MIGIWFGLALVIGAWLGWPAIAASFGVAAVAILQGGRGAIWSVGLVCFALIGVLRVNQRADPRIPEWTGSATQISGSIVSGPVETGVAQRFILNAIPDSTEPAKVSSARLCASAPVLPAVSYGDQIAVTGTIQRLDDVPSGFAGYLRGRGCVGSIQVRWMNVISEGSGVRASLDHVRNKITFSLQQAFPGDTGVLLAGLVTGDDAALSATRRDAFVSTGTSHVTAVSGSNLAVIVSLLAFFGALARHGKTTGWQLVVIAALWAYVAIIGPTAPPLRAAMVATLAVICVRLGRKPDFVTLSVIVAAVELMVRPTDFSLLAFRLSTISAIALVLGLAGRSPKGLRGKIAHAVVATTVTQAATSPFLVPTFGRFALYAIPANIVVASLCSLAFPFALLGGLAGLLDETLALAITAPAAVPARLALVSVSWIAELPGSDAGASIASAVPDSVWIITGILTVIALSRECRGGIARRLREYRVLSAERRTVLGGATIGMIGGILAGLWLR